MGSDNHGEWKPVHSKEQFLHYLNSGEYMSDAKTSVNPNDDVKFLLAKKPEPKPTISIRVYKWLLKAGDYISYPFWWAYDGITQVLWCGELNKLYDEINVIRRERDELLVKLELSEALVKVLEERDKFKQAAGTDEANPFKDFYPAPKVAKSRLKPVGKKSAKKNVRRKRR